MLIDDFQTQAVSTAIYPDHARVYYPALGLAGEVGEVCNKIKKIIRDAGGVITEEVRAELRKEMGDVGWYWMALMRDLNLLASDVCQGVLDKLADRKARGVIGGSGDNR